MLFVVKMTSIYEMIIGDRVFFMSFLSKIKRQQSFCVFPHYVVLEVLLLFG